MIRNLFRILVAGMLFSGRAMGIELVDGKLASDLLLSGTAHWWQYQIDGVRGTDRAFERVIALVGLTGRISPAATIRCYFDIGQYWGGPVLDMYAQLMWENGFGLRAGQFVLPLGFDAISDLGKQKLINGSFVGWYVKPAGTRDIGVATCWRRESFLFEAALVNGAGANAGDNNGQKDVCGRVELRPFAEVDAAFAARGYFGWPEQFGPVWRTAALEATYRTGSLEFQSEVQNHSSPTAKNSAAYLQAAYVLGRFEPVLRVDAILPWGQRPEAMLTGGINLMAIPDHMRVMLDYSYRRNGEEGWSVAGFLLRLQASI